MKRSLLLFFSRIIYFIARCFYKVLKVFLKPLVNSHPRVHTFAVAVRDAFKELIRPAGGDPAAAPAALLDVMHEVIAEDRKKHEIPAWLIGEWKEMHEIEPQLFPETWLVNTVSLYRVPDSRVGDHYLELCTLYGEDVSHVFLVPWLKRGGADLVTINYVNAILQEKPSAGIVLITTLDADSPWAERLPAGVRFIEFGRLYPHLSPDEQESLLTRVLIQKAPKVIHTINSDLAYRALVKHGKALSGISDLYACSFCEDITPEGKYVGYPFMYLPRCFDSLKAVFSDNRTFLAKLHEIYAFDTDKMHVHYQPVSLPPRRIAERAGRIGQHLDILWAGRLDRQKRPDILIGIAEKCQGLPFTFHVYGSPVIDTKIYAEAFDRLDNIRYGGSFNGLASLKPEEYDLFLYTSQWDGLPNVVLEAASLGLPVVASDVGGISEFIADRETGFLVAPYDDIERYVDCLRAIAERKEMLSAVAEKALDLIVRRHSWERFLEDLRNIPGYAGG